MTKDLDEGPIIEQDVVRVTHAMTAADLQARGAYVERAVLGRAVQWHAEDRVIRTRQPHHRLHRPPPTHTDAAPVASARMNREGTHG